MSMSRHQILPVLFGSMIAASLIATTAHCADPEKMPDKEQKLTKQALPAAVLTAEARVAIGTEFTKVVFDATGRLISSEMSEFKDEEQN